LQHIVSLPQHSVVPESEAVGLIAWGVSALGQEDLGRGSASQELFRVCFQDCFGQKGNRRESNQMTFIKILSLSPSPFESSLSCVQPFSHHTRFQMCDQKRDSAQFQLWLPLEFTSLVCQLSIFSSLLPKSSIDLCVGAICFLKTLSLLRCR